MNRRDFLKAVGACALTMPALSGLRALGPDDDARARNSVLCPASGKRPNVILVLCDDLGWGDLGRFWQNSRADADKAHIDTPHLDAAMARGVMLTNAYTTAPVCAPARASMVSGKHQGNCNLRDNMFDRPVDTHMTLGTVMKQAGYATWHLGKWGIGGGYQSGGQPRRAMACDAGFDYSYGYPAHMHGHAYYHFEGNGTDWKINVNGSPIVENVSAEAHAEGRYAALSQGANGMAFERDTDGTYYRRLIANAEVQFCYDTDLFTAKLKQLIRTHQDARREEPFFCYACYTTVHGSGNRMDSAIGNQTQFHVPGDAYPAADANDSVWGGGVRWEKNTAGALPFKATAATANTCIHPDYSAYATESLRRYATSVRRLDDALGDLLRFLRLRGLEENTLFVFTSDNGPAGEQLSPGGYTWVNDTNGTGLKSNGPFKGMKRWSYEGGLREPTFAVWPAGIPASGADTPRVSAVPFQFPAWMATLADAAGLPQPAHCDGVSLLPTLAGAGRQLPMRVYTEYSDGGSGQNFGFEQMVRDGDYVLIRNKGVGGTPELYNVTEDNGQATNLANDPAHADRVRWMTDLLVSCRVPASKIPAACGAPQAFSSAPDALNTSPLPATPRAGTLPPCEVRVYREGAEGWPWVPNFRTLLPDAGFLASDAAALVAKLPSEGAFGISVQGWIETPATGDVTFSAEGAGGCQLWLHEAHILEYEAGDCVAKRTIVLPLAAGRHPFRLYLTTRTGNDGLCRVFAGPQPLV